MTRYQMSDAMRQRIAKRCALRIAEDLRLHPGIFCDFLREEGFSLTYWIDTLGEFIRWCIDNDNGGLAKLLIASAFSDWQEIHCAANRIRRGIVSVLDLDDVPTDRAREEDSTR